MFLHRIRLRNYRKYREADVEIPPGLVGIVGRNGAGKSTLVDAIGWCLYGGRVEHTRHAGAAEGETCSVELEMEIGQDRVRIVRELRGRSASARASAFVNGEERPSATGAADVSDFVAKRTGMDRTAFFISVFAQQKELDALSRLGPQQRKDTIMRLLRIDEINDALEAVRRDARESRERARVMEGSLEDPAELQGRLDGLAAEREANSASMRECAARADALGADVEAKRARSKEMQALRGRHEDARNARDRAAEAAKSRSAERERLEGELAGAREARGKARALAPRTRGYAAAQRDLRTLEAASAKAEEREALEQRRAALASEISGQESENRSREKDLEETAGLGARLRALEKRLEAHRSEEKGLAGAIRALDAGARDDRKSRAKRLKEAAAVRRLGRKGRCPMCKRPLDDHVADAAKTLSSEAADLSKKIAEAGRERRNAAAKLDQAKAAAAGLEREIRGARRGEIERESAQTSLREGRKALARLRRDEARLAPRLKKLSAVSYDRERHRAAERLCAELSEAKDEKSRLSAEAGRIPGLSRRIKEASGEIARSSRERDRAARNLESLGYDRKEDEAYAKELEDAEKAHKEAAVERAELKGEGARLASEIRAAEEGIRRGERTRAEIAEEREKARLRGLLEEALQGFRQDLVSRIGPSLSHKSSELLKTVTRGKYPTMGLDGNYGIQIGDGGTDYGVGRFSGGEGDLANLCLRIAISQELVERAGGAQDNFIVLDEVFGSQDEERKRSILQALDGLSGQFRQILVITHIEDVKEALPYALAVKERPDGTAVVVPEGQMASRLSN